MERAKTIILDIDGTLIEHCGEISQQFLKTPKLLIGTLEKLTEWDKKGYNLILITGRREGVREVTVKQLSELGIFYDQLIMGVGGGVRILINDKKVDSKETTAQAISIDRNKGIRDIKI
jgi:phosphoglycolate phosphatase-like HAD superfamily hydrolase